MNTRTFRDLFVERPVPDKNACTLCYQCKKICPAGAIGSAKNGNPVPQYDYGTCIRCYCCLEICPEGAVSKKPGRLQWLLGFLEK
ncbi:MAG: 4Fe-4S binding protein [Desulfobacterales bacterium]|nr:4Fe-4S binding protein [Desulfobacterales bacterium]